MTTTATRGRLGTNFTPPKPPRRDNSALVDAFECLREHSPYVHPVLLGQPQHRRSGPFDPEPAAAATAGRLDAEAAGVNA